MYSPEEHEKIVRNLVNTFNDRDELHTAYKSKIKELIRTSMMEFLHFCSEKPDDEAPNLEEWINNFVEERFKPE